MPIKKNVTNLQVNIAFKPLKSVFGWYHAIDGNKCEIEIKRSLSQLDQLETLAHECAHMLCDLLRPDNSIKFLNARPAKKLGRGKRIITLTKTQDDEEELCYSIANDTIKRIKEYLKP